MLRDDLAAHLSEPVLAYARRDVPLLHPEMTIAEALEHIRTTGVGERIIYFYVADAQDRLLGVVPTRRLLISPLENRIQDVMASNVIAIPGTATLLEACELFVLYKYLAFPVLGEQRKVLGVVDISFFAAEVFEMTAEDSYDEIFEAIGLHVEQLRHASTLRAFRHRFPWLLGTIASGTACALLAGAFEETLSQALTLAFFLPLVLGLNESVSMQSMSLSLQALYAGKQRLGMPRGRFRRELLTSGLLAAGTALIVAIVAALWRGSLESALILGGAILLSVIFAGALGFAMPIALRLGRRDPKIAAGPLTLATVDVVALLIYFTLATIAMRS